MSVMPHLGHLAGLSKTTSGCIGQVYFACRVAGWVAGTAFIMPGIMWWPPWPEACGAGVWSEPSSDSVLEVGGTGELGAQQLAGGSPENDSRPLRELVQA